LREIRLSIHHVTVVDLGDVMIFRCHPKNWNRLDSTAGIVSGEFDSRERLVDRIGRSGE